MLLKLIFINNYFRLWDHAFISGNMKNKASHSHARTRSLDDTPAGWTPLPGWYRDESHARQWIEIWSRRNDGFSYQAFPYAGVRRTGEATMSYRVCRQRIECLEWAI